MGMGMRSTGLLVLACLQAQRTMSLESSEVERAYVMAWQSDAGCLLGVVK